MRRIALVLGCLVLVRSGVAGEVVASGTGSAACVIAVNEPNPVSVGLLQRADSITLSITVSSEQRDPELRADEIRQVRELLKKKAHDSVRIQVRNGPVSLSARPQQKTDNSLSSVSEPVSQASFDIIVAIDKNKGDIYSSVGDARRFVSDLRLPGKTLYSVGEPVLSVDNPEQYRKQLLQRVAQELGTMKEIFGGKTAFTFEGLHRPVMVRAVDDINVELFIPYSVEVRLND